MSTKTLSKPDKTQKTSPQKLTPEQLRLLTEVQRQEYYISRLPVNYRFPLFSGAQAVKSQRQSGYRTTAKAAREIVDNAIEAGAKNVRIIFDIPSEDNRERHELRNNVRAVAFIDDGPGMGPEMARYALTWGGGTHYDDPKEIGKFGFGLPNSSINQTTLVQVFTRTSGDEPWHCVQLDINHVDEHGEVEIPEGEDAELPEFVTSYLERNNIDLANGTVVLWVKPDRLTYNKASTLREHLLEDFGVTYRYMLPRYETDPTTNRSKAIYKGRARITIDEKPVEAIDPLFLLPGARYYQAPTKELDGGAWETFGQNGNDGRQIAVAYFADPDTGSRKMVQLKTDEELEAAKVDPTVRSVGYIQVRIGRMPPGFIEGIGQAKKEQALPWKRFQIRQSRRGISFVRSDREIETLDAFPRSAHDKASGLGDWGHISTLAYHFGIEILFPPNLDEAFGVGNDKQTIRPIDDFWRIMHDIELDKAFKAEERYQAKTRNQLKNERNAKKATEPNKSDPAESAAAAAAASMGGSKTLPPERQQEANDLTEKNVAERAKLTGSSIESARGAIEAEAKRKRYKIDFFESEGGVFYKPGYGNGMQKVAMINKLHPFFTTFYTKLEDLEQPIARQSIDLLLLALAEAELRTEGEDAQFYEDERESQWSRFLKVGLKKLESLDSGLEEEDLNADE